MLLIQLASMNVCLIYVITPILSVLLRVFLSHHYVDVFETSVLKEVRILGYLQNSSTMPIPGFQSNAIVCCTC